MVLGRFSLRIATVLVVVSTILVGCGNDKKEDGPRLDSANDGNALIVSTEKTTDQSTKSQAASPDLTNLQVISTENIDNLQVLYTAQGDDPNIFDLVLATDERLLIGVGSQLVDVWNATTFEHLYHIRTSNNELWTANISPDGTYILTAGNSSVFQRWDTTSGEEMADFPDTLQAITSINFTADGNPILGQVGGITQIFDIDTQAFILEVAWSRGRQFVASSSVSPDGTMLATAHPAGTIALWDMTTGERIDRLIGHNSDVLAVAFSPDGSLLASGAMDNSARIWDMATHETRFVLGHPYSVRWARFSPNGKLLATAGQDGTIRLWDVDTGEELHAMPGAITDGTVWAGSAIFNQAGTLLIYSYANTVTAMGIPLN